MFDRMAPPMNIKIAASTSMPAPIKPSTARIVTPVGRSMRPPRSETWSCWRAARSAALLTEDESGATVRQARSVGQEEREPGSETTLEADSGAGIFDRQLHFRHLTAAGLFLYPFGLP